jgi:uncharacterized protein YdaU (DUF1376 family)
MAEFPAMPLWTDAYLGDTTHLSTFEHGAYLLLLIVSWRSPGCCLPDDDRLLGRYARVTTDKWRKIRPILEPFFKVENGIWRQARLQDEFQHLQSQKVNASKAGQASAKAKSLKRQNRGSTPVRSALQRNANGTPTPIPTPNTLDKSNAASAASNDDPVKQIFDLGCALLTAAGTPEKQARSLLGKWRKAAKSDGEVITALIDCRARAISEPVEWLQKRFNGAAYVSASGHEYRGSREQILREAERRNDMGTYWQIKRELADEQRAAN